MPTTKELLHEAKLAISRRYAANAIDNMDPERQDLIDRRPPPLIDPETGSVQDENFYRRRNDSLGAALIKRQLRRGRGRPRKTIHVGK